MKWKGRRQSSNVEDRRGMGMGGKTVIGGGIGSIIIVLLFTLLGGNPGDLLGSNQASDTGSQAPAPYQESAGEKELADFVSVVLADTEDVWSDEFKKKGLQYENPKLVLYTGSVQSACGSASSAVGPFYCPGDHKLYIDLSFYQELKQKFQAPGDFAMAYVIAHEVGHHVQTLLHSGDQASQARKRSNEYSVRFELQADYLAGVWAHYAQGKGYLEKGDLEEAVNAASAVGDDNIQKKSQGYVVPESFTHGTSEQRKRWFTKGFKNGTIEGGDTFNAANL
ncbi:zinc metallopeptidase [Neobacillus sp. MER 74]|uniref:KPN_02809 family neutral zinc metallopeptidase n=1 Tax=Bacillaceae TaxID=186817 RepID=UPI000BF6B909|nr:MULTISPECIES: neutral zinc metallopeptidase [Bacillaceae]MCM3117860.1 zinc metallopeptidase [Neobacillus sp. MER 74]PFP29271.1 metalloprotease [Bacillus sp. AFS073361]